MKMNLSLPTGDVQAADMELMKMNPKKDNAKSVGRKQKVG